ncbi:MAG: hypothetical protein HW421_3566 [Ignavibacteria bacterium]|nr:hypothetical protein [Ignavibacteria bacterium]
MFGIKGESLLEVFLGLIQIIFYTFGGILSWLVKGCRTKLKDELSRTHKKRNILISIFFWIITFTILIIINN